MRLLKVLGLLVLLTLLAFGVIYKMVIYTHPNVPVSKIEPSQLVKISDSHYVLNNSWIKKNEFGNWECYVEGNGYERGRTIGILQKQLGAKQEAVFVSEIENNVSSWWLRKILIVGISWFNKDLDQKIPMEYQNEIFGISEFFSDDFDYIGPKYNRIINYHAAHDIGHAVQNMHIVGCTAVGAWKFDSTENSMIIGRNFDFYFGDDFAKQKVILISKPDTGYSSISITWPSFIGVVSGINDQGLGITLNSAKSEIPSKTGTPVSIIAREILQYAQNIEQAVAISKKYDAFVSETFTISSLKDQKVVVIEKTPNEVSVFAPATDTIVVTNHFQSDGLKNTQLNLEHIQTSESLRRYNRTKELIQESSELSVTSLAGVLRDQKGVHSANIGLGNPLAINQLLAHHSVIFENVTGQVHVSTFPFQLGNFTTYNLNNIAYWNSEQVQFPIYQDSIVIVADPFLTSTDYEKFLLYKELKSQVAVAIDTKKEAQDKLVAELLKSNAYYYESYLIAGNYYYEVNRYEEAKEMYQMALSKEIAYLSDKEFMEERLDEIKQSSYTD